MKISIEGYQNFPGEHCGSVAMRGLLNHYCGLALPEPAVFGLSSGIECAYFAGEGTDPARLVFGRTMSLETDLAENLQVDYRERTEEDDDRAWQQARDEVISGRPTMLSGDILYLDYREYKVHFPGHRFVLLGFDDETEKALIADRINVTPERCSYSALRKSRNPPEGMSTKNLWGRFHSPEVGRELAEAARISIERAAAHMLEESSSTDGGPSAAGSRSFGLVALRRLADEIPGWADREDASWIASYNARCIEKFGNGGGNFRRLYAGFLAWAHDLSPKLAPEGAAQLTRESADEWTALSEILNGLSKRVQDRRAWKEAGVRAGRIAELETRLFRSLAG